MKTNCSQFSFEYILLGISVSQFFNRLYNYKTRNVIVLKYVLYISLKNIFFYFSKNFLLQLKCKKKKNEISCTKWNTQTCLRKRNAVVDLYIFIFNVCFHYNYFKV